MARKTPAVRCLNSFTGAEDGWCQDELGHKRQHWLWQGQKQVRWTTGKPLPAHHSERRQARMVELQEMVTLSLHYLEWLTKWMNSDNPPAKPPSFAEWVRDYAGGSKAPL